MNDQTQEPVEKERKASRRPRSSGSLRAILWRSVILAVTLAAVFCFRQTFLGWLRDKEMVAGYFLLLLGISALAGTNLIRSKAEQAKLGTLKRHKRYLWFWAVVALGSLANVSGSWLIKYAA